MRLDSHWSCTCCACCMSIGPCIGTEQKVENDLGFVVEQDERLGVERLRSVKSIQESRMILYNHISSKSSCVTILRHKLHNKGLWHFCGHPLPKTYSKNWGIFSWHPGDGHSDPATAALTDDGLALVASRS